MIDKNYLARLIKEEISGKGIFVVDLDIKPSNKIVLYIDSLQGVNIKDCSELSKFIEANLNRKIEDYELEVSSPGLNRPLKVHQQYVKNIGRNVEIIDNNGLKLIGKLTNVFDNEIEIEEQIIVKSPDKNRNKKTTQSKRLEFCAIKSTKVLITFK